MRAAIAITHNRAKSLSRRGDSNPDPFITSELLYQLSYVGAVRPNDSRLHALS